MLGAGLAGIKEELQLPEEFTSNAFALSREELVARGIRMLPTSLSEAIDLFESSALMKELLGEHIHTYFVQNKREECEAYNANVSQWELDRYLPVL
jgi:glutamine synthetase